jgi:hypothetical protein
MKIIIIIINITVIIIIIIKYDRSKLFGNLIFNSVQSECDVFAFSEIFRNTTEFRGTDRSVPKCVAYVTVSLVGVSSIVC